MLIDSITNYVILNYSLSKVNNEIIRATLYNESIKKLEAIVDLSRDGEFHFRSVVDEVIVSLDVTISGDKYNVECYHSQLNDDSSNES